MKNVRLFSLCLILTAFLLSGCTFSNRGNATELQADENGKLIHTIIEKADKSLDIDALEQYVKERVAAANGSDARAEEDTAAASAKAKSSDASSKSSGEGVSLQSCRIKDGAVQIRIDYNSYQDYMQFNGTQCFFGTIQDAEEQGYSFDGGFLNEKGKLDKEANATIQERASEWKVLIVEEPMRVRVPDKILYTSENMKKTGRMTAAYTGKQSTASDPDVEGGRDTEASSTGKEKDGKETEAARSGSPLDQFVIDDFDLAYVIFK